MGVKMGPNLVSEFVEGSYRQLYHSDWGYKNLDNKPRS